MWIVEEPDEVVGIVGKSEQRSDGRDTVGEVECIAFGVFESSQDSGCHWTYVTAYTSTFVCTVETIIISLDRTV